MFTQTDNNLLAIATITWSVIFSITLLVMWQLSRKGLKHFKLRHLFFFSFIAALYCWVGAYSNNLEGTSFDKIVPILGIVAAFAVIATPMMIVKHQYRISGLFFRLLFPLMMTFASGTLSFPSVKLASLPAESLERQIGYLIFIFIMLFFTALFVAILPIDLKLLENATENENAVADDTDISEEVINS